MIASSSQSVSEGEWRTARRLYSIYSAVISHFDVGIPPCADLESPIDRSESSARSRVRTWFSLMDERCSVAYLRQVLQTSLIATEENLRALIFHHLRRSPKVESDREKLDFLLVQYFSQCASDGFGSSQLSLAYVGKVLEPVLGSVQAELPDWLKKLEKLTEDLGKCRCMSDLTRHRVLERGRELKTAAGDRFFEPHVLVAFTLYNILLRRAFFAAMRTDLEIVRLNVGELARLGIRSIDASRAGLSERESLDSVNRICREWRTIFRTDYAAGHVFRAVQELRSATDEALSRAIKRKHGKKEHAKSAAEGVKRKPGAKDAAQMGLPLGAEDAEPDHPPEVTVEQVYPELTVESDPVAGTPLRFRLPEVLDRIHKQLKRARLDKLGFRPFAAILNDTAVRLSSWEAKAFFADSTPVVLAIRFSVGARLILQEAFDSYQEGEETQLPAALAVAHGEAGKIQELIAQSRDARKSDQALYLAATAQRLISLIEEAEYVLSAQEENQ